MITATRSPSKQWTEFFRKPIALDRPQLADMRRNMRAASRTSASGHRIHRSSPRSKFDGTRFYIFFNNVPAHRIENPIFITSACSR
ncbi:hypothetical protein C7S16_5080 [Burkholderia thailandensis]|uniref:Uncharacterized protein n=1 Tax=Burkholderia thailandensis TaxID=57975 RepID=A0AAW9CYB0_BURTH|nr:hypothetical protein [Burkholderia thailandensis]MDW9252744.1 hypothetical protein [Burkholderia thailandensis]